MENELIVKESKTKYIILFGLIALGIGFYFYNKLNINFGEVYPWVISLLPQNSQTFFGLLLIVLIGGVIIKGAGWLNLYAKKAITST